ncbi:MAG: BREX-3 system phosphatase PglZ [Ktedonobacteraceae bacterium]
MSESALEAILELFPPHTHPLTLVSDPDELLADEEVIAALKKRGFQILQGEDPIRLRLAVRQMKSFTVEWPVVVVTTGELNSLPYDLWQQGRHITLSLSTCWPGLEVGVLHTLTPRQRKLLGDDINRSMTTQLTARETKELVLQRVFGFNSEQISTPATLVRWLAEYHAGKERLPTELSEHVLARLRTSACFAGWPLEQLIGNTKFFHSWVQREWEGFVAGDLQKQATTATGIVNVPFHNTEVKKDYTPGELQFSGDPALQDALGTLVRYGAIQPVPVQTRESNHYEPWAQPGIIAANEQIWEAQLAAALTAVEEMLEHSIQDWEGWRRLALRWAEIAIMRNGMEYAFPASMNERYEQAERMIDDSFVEWLAARYTQLAGRALPIPHHLYHVPAKLARDVRMAPQARVALLVLDGLSLADWLLIRSMWVPRHQDWRFEEICVLAQVPSITSVSRQALIGGMRPNEITQELIERPREEQAWEAFWRRNALPRDGISFERLPDVVDADYPTAITSHRTRALCLISTVIDDIVHGATQGAAGVHAEITVWLNRNADQEQDEAAANSGISAEALQQGSIWIEGMIDLLLTEGYTVTITGDHGHVEAIGVGNPSDGVLASTRSKRTRLYSSLELAQAAAARLPDTMMIDADWLRPQGVFPVVALRRSAYAPKGERVVTHGGLTVEEMIVPLITLTRRVQK